MGNDIEPAYLCNNAAPIEEIVIIFPTFVKNT